MKECTRSEFKRSFINWNKNHLSLYICAKDETNNKIMYTVGIENVLCNILIFKTFLV